MRQINLIPFVQLHDYLHLLSLHAINPHIVLRNTIGQIIFAMPLGLLIPASFKNITFPKGLFLILLLGIAYNILKYITHLGSFDIDDLLYELIGFTAGYFIICSRTKNAPH
jgi:glycopeptide antibiotics resistance protein